MTVTVKQAYVVSCDECPQASKARPLIIHAKEDWKDAEEFRKEHERFHADRDRLTDSALQKARIARNAISKMSNPLKCQCFCPRTGAEHVCNEDEREVVVHFPYFIAGMGVKAAVMCHPCSVSWMARMLVSNDETPASWEVRYFEKDKQTHMACFELLTGKELPDGNPDSEADRGTEGAEPASGGDPDDAVLHVRPSATGTPTDQ